MHNEDYIFSNIKSFIMEDNGWPSTEMLEKEISDERERLSTDRMDISFGEIMNLYKNNELFIRPEYQRLFRWSIKQKTALIESILLGIPIPPIFVAEDKNGVWELVDGLQRISTFISFFGQLNDDLTQITVSEEQSADDFEDIESESEDVEGLRLWNKWVLEAGGLIKSLKGHTIDTLPNKYRINLKRAVCRVEILRGESNIEMKYELFKRLNSGGSNLTPQEIRNAIFRGVSSDVNELLLSLSQESDFKYLTGLSDQKKQELYDQELVLRFIALLDNAQKVNNNLEQYLDKYMEEAVESSDFCGEKYRELFLATLSLIKGVGDQSVFRNSKNFFVPALFEGITIGVAQNIEKYRLDSELLKSKIQQIKDDNDFKKYSGSASNSRSRIRNRLIRANEIFSM